MRIAAAVALVALVAGCARAPDPWEKYESRVEQWGEERSLTLGGGDWRLRPFADEGRHTCIAHLIPGQGGRSCFVAGWVVESGVISRGSTRLMVVVSHPRVDEVRIPRRNGTVATFEPEPLPWGHGLTLMRWNRSFPKDFGNQIAGYDADGTKLGNEHWNVGRKRNYAGPWDGLIDARWAPARDVSAARRGAS